MFFHVVDCQGGRVGGLVERIKNESVCKIRKLYSGRQIKNELFFIAAVAEA